MKPTHWDRITQLKQYILDHCDQPLDRAGLAEMTGYSIAHLHRIFTALEGESISAYVRRARMQQAAKRLVSEDIDITVIALDTGYETHAAFSKAFKQFYGITPTEFRQRMAIRTLDLISRRFSCTPTKESNVEPNEIVTIGEKTVLYARASEIMTGPAFKTANVEANNRLMGFLEKHNLFPHIRHIVAIYPDSPEVGLEARFDMGAIFTEGVEPEPEEGMGYQILPAGEWAMFLHVGTYDTLWKTWNAAYRDWLPHSGYDVCPTAPFEDYVDNPMEVPPEKLRTEIYIPVKRQS